MQESCIVYERGSFWIRADADRFTVFRAGITHSTSDSAYPKTIDGLSLAQARVDYLAKREKTPPIARHTAGSKERGEDSNHV